MRKALCIFLTLALLLMTIPVSADTDLSSMTDEELELLIQNAQNELNQRKESAFVSSQQTNEIVTVKEAGFSLLSKGKWLYYSFTAHSNLTDKAIQYPEFKIIVRDAKGNLIISDNQVLNILYPNQDIAWSGQGGNVEGESPASIKIEFVEPISDRYLINPSSADYPDLIPLKIENSRIKNDGHILGEFSNPNPYDIKQVAISVLFRDENNCLLGGNTAFVNGAKAGETTTFEINISKAMVTDKYDIFVQPWF